MSNFAAQAGLTFDAFFMNDDVDTCSEGQPYQDRMYGKQDTSGYCVTGLLKYQVAWHGWRCLDWIGFDSICLSLSDGKQAAEEPWLGHDKCRDEYEF